MIALTNKMKKWFLNYDKSLIKLEILILLTLSITAVPIFLKFSLVDYDRYTTKKSLYSTALFNENLFKKEMLGNDLIPLRENILDYTTGFSKILHCENDEEAKQLQQDFEYVFNWDVGFLLIDKDSGRYFSNRNWFKDYPYSELTPKDALIKLSKEDDVILYYSEDITHYKAPFGYYNGAFNPPSDSIEEIYFIRGTDYGYIADNIKLRFCFSIPCIIIFFIILIKHLVSIKRVHLKNYLLMYDNILIVRLYKSIIFSMTHMELILKRIFWDRLYISLIVFWSMYLPLYYIFNSNMHFIGIQNYTYVLLLITLFIIIFMVFIRFIESISNGEKLLKYLNKIEDGDVNISINPDNLGNFKNLGLALNKLKVSYTNKINDGIKNEKLKTELITNVSHDLRTPLTSIINYVDILKDENLTKEQIKDYIYILDNKATRLQSLVEDLFEMSKMTSGQITLEKSKVDMVELIHQSLGELAFLGEDKHLIFKVVGLKSCFVTIDGARMSRVMDNLICNAIKYSLENSRIYLSIKSNYSNCIIEVKNISKYDLDFNEEEVLERFVRGERSRNSSVEGSGLGLAIAKTIVDLHHGEIKIKCDGDLFKVIIQLPL